MDDLVQQLVLGDGALKAIHLPANTGSAAERLRFVQLLSIVPNGVRRLSIHCAQGENLTLEMEDALSAFVQSTASLEELNIQGGNAPRSVRVKKLANEDPSAHIVH